MQFKEYQQQTVNSIFSLQVAFLQECDMRTSPPGACDLSSTQLSTALGHDSRYVITIASSYVVNAVPPLFAWMLTRKLVHVLLLLKPGFHDVHLIHHTKCLQPLSTLIHFVDTMVASCTIPFYITVCCLTTAYLSMPRLPSPPAHLTQRQSQQGPVVHQKITFPVDLSFVCGCVYTEITVAWAMDWHGAWSCCLFSIGIL